MDRIERVKRLCEAALETGADASTGTGIDIRSDLIDELRVHSTPDLKTRLQRTENPVEREIIETIMRGRQTIPGLFI